MIALSGVAGATSWLFGFKALAAGGQVSQVMPIDKLSVPLAAILSVLLLRDRPSTINWTGNRADRLWGISRIAPATIAACADGKARPASPTSLGPIDKN